MLHYSLKEHMIKRGRRVGKKLRYYETSRYFVKGLQDFKGCKFYRTAGDFGNKVWSPAFNVEHLNEHSSTVLCNV